MSIDSGAASAGLASRMLTYAATARKMDSFEHLSLIKMVREASTTDEFDPRSCIFDYATELAARVNAAVQMKNSAEFEYMTGLPTHDLAESLFQAATQDEGFSSSPFHAQAL